MEEAEPFPDDWTPNMRANLVFLTRRGYVLLIHKKTGLGAGKINGPGGKLEPGETALEAARREVREELLIEVGELEEMGELHFDFVDGLKLHCVVFHGTEFNGTPTETREAKPEWFPIAELPLDRMWADDRHWLPQMLAGQRFQAWFRFDGETMISRKVLFEPRPAEVNDSNPELTRVRAIVFVLVVIPVIYLSFASAVSSVLGRTSPIYSKESNVGEVVYLIVLIIAMVMAIWTPSRKMLIIATVMLLPIVVLLAVLTYFIPFFAPLLLLPILWAWFFCVAWPAYTKGKSSKA